MQESIDILQKGEYGILSMCTPTNEGYGIPLNYAYDGNNLYFHCAKEGSKLDYLRNNPKVSFCVVGETKVMPSQFGTLYESVIVSGNALEMEGDEKQEALKQLIEKYSGNFIKEGKEYIEKLIEKVTVIKLTVESLNGKARK
jgi:nitroimidazol reductase NimA-like FMN-containing flavoprotein (pyridoxamine 5'-phosphate oxidase superfamily)